MKGKRVFYCETAYIVGLITLAIGTALMEKADFGMSMIVAPAYLLHLKVSRFLPFFSFGVSVYVFQALLLVLLSVVMRRVKKGYLLSFVTAFIYGLVLDAMIAVVALVPFAGIAWRVVYFAVGLVICTTGVAFMFHTYFPPEAYEMFVKELSEKFGTPLGKAKTIYDCCSFALSVILSLLFFGTFVGIEWGTVVTAFLNGWLIGRISKILEAKFTFKDALPLRDRLQ